MTTWCGGNLFFSQLQEHKAFWEMFSLVSQLQ